MPLSKAHVSAILEKMPDDIDPEDLEYKLYVLKKLARGDEEVAAGRGYTTEEVPAEIDRWSK